MSNSKPIALFWFRRDLRLNDNRALNAALKNHKNVLPIFIFDANILEELNPNDARVTFIHQTLDSINKELKKYGSSVKCIYGSPLEVFKSLIKTYTVTDVYLNRDYEPYAADRDKSIYELLTSKNIKMTGFKDQVIFEKLEVTKNDGTPYTVFTPYKKKWISQFSEVHAQQAPLINTENFHKCTHSLMPIEDLNFKKSTIEVPKYNLNVIPNYAELRDYPSKNSTSYLGTHLRFGTVSIRELVSNLELSSTFLSELIWRDFFKQIIYNFPKVVSSNFKQKYDGIEWRNNPDEFKAWCEGKTGYPIVDAGMIELNKTGLMHNRVRMITAGFLCKHLLIDWRWGEAYFASKLLDYDLSANNGNWQWAAGTGCDAAPYFRIFNPTEQQKRFDKEFQYIEKWNPNWKENTIQIVEHKYARKRALETYSKGILK
ncbi:MAG: deoxyribodipyrimidine photo-lyase [Flavobacteriales bacterium]|nr:deoxyribodipyrimidine photo-lyase [Flavobacteriales bacterium]